ncbi:MAG: DUF1887 family CARF protein [Moraxella sp.]|nr:DUF1887 family CARF protein [Moraxella sp.]
MKTLICLVSAQSAANMNSINDINPDKVVLMTTSSMTENANNLMTELKNIGKSSELFHITQENSMQSLSAQYNNWLNDNIGKCDEIVVNITGGTKLMSITAYNVFSDFGVRCFYQNLEPNQLMWLDDESVIDNIGYNTSLKRYLKIYRFDIKNSQSLADIPKAHKEYAKLLFEELCYPNNYEYTLSLIGKINAHTAKKKMELNNYTLGSDDINVLSELMNETGLFTLDDNKIKCVDEQARTLMNGGWLEIIVADKMRGKDYRDISQSVEIAKSTQRKGVHTNQELDVMAMRGNQLVMVECKTKKWENATDASGAIYKLSSLRDIGGLNTYPIFVSLRDLPASAKTRAAEMGVKVISGQTDIMALSSKLMEHT